MEIRDIELVLSKALADLSDETNRVEYIHAIMNYLEEKKSNDELLTIIVKGLAIDDASAYFEYIGQAQKNDVQSIWKQIRENKYIYEDKENNGLKFLMKLFTISFLHECNISGLKGNIISKIVSVVDYEKRPISANVYKEIILVDFLEKVYEKSPIPVWESFKTNGNSCKRFAEILLESIDEGVNKYALLRRWALRGIEYANELIERERIESTIPKSKVDELQSIVDHYKIVEKQVTDNAFLIAKLEKEELDYQEQIRALSEEKISLKNEIENLSQNLTDYKDIISVKEDEINARKKINDAADALNKNDREALLRDIANDLKSEYQDFVESENDVMDEQLGEIYREKIKNIFKVLSNKGIRMD